MKMRTEVKDMELTHEAFLARIKERAEQHDADLDIEGVKQDIKDLDLRLTTMETEFGKTSNAWYGIIRFTQDSCEVIRNESPYQRLNRLKTDYKDAIRELKEDIKGIKETNSAVVDPDSIPFDLDYALRTFVRGASPKELGQTLLSYVRELSEEDSRESRSPRDTSKLVGEAYRTLLRVEEISEETQEVVISEETKTSYLTLVGRMIMGVEDGGIFKHYIDEEGVMDVELGNAFYLKMKSDSGLIQGENGALYVDALYAENQVKLGRRGSRIAQEMFPNIGQDLEERKPYDPTTNQILNNSLDKVCEQCMSNYRTGGSL